MAVDLFNFFLPFNSKFNRYILYRITKDRLPKNRIMNIALYCVATNLQKFEWLSIADNIIIRQVDNLVELRCGAYEAHSCIDARRNIFAA